MVSSLNQINKMIEEVNDAFPMVVPWEHVYTQCITQATNQRFIVQKL